MLYKMLSYERLQISYDTAGAGFVGGKRRQLFITKSRTLARRVEEYFTSLAKSLDRTFNLTLGGVAGRQLDSDSVASDELIFEDDGDIDKYRPDLPLRFSELKDDHFPLFLTFDKVSISNLRLHNLLTFLHSCTVCWKMTMICSFLNARGRVTIEKL